MVSARDTLIIKHLPPDLSDSDKEELLKHFGAKEVRCISSKIKKYNVVFARFENEQVTDHVLLRLHQLEINGSRLSVEYTNKSIFPDKEQVFQDIENEEQKENEKLYKKFMEKLNSWHSSFNFKQPIPCHLRYQYPPPDNVVLLNIAKALATVPKFYTQVLHLMNKMNLPCPFQKDILPDFKMQLFTVQNPCETTEAENITLNEETMAEIAENTSESEISSDDEINKQKETIPDQVQKRKKKVINLPKFVKPMQVPQGIQKPKKTSIDEVFEKAPQEREIKKIKLCHPPLDINKTSFVEIPLETSSGFGYIHPSAKPPSPPPSAVDIRDAREEERLEKPEIKCISIEELQENTILEKDWSVLPVFKNYAEGAPTSRLYIKNLAKTVTEEDLRYIYNRYVSKDPLETHVMDIRLMQEGRMKGQAFITFHSVQAAQTALKETNGFILKEKPLVVQFARSATK